MNKKIINFQLTVLIIIVLINGSLLHAQYPWPVEPKNQSQQLTGTFCEFRDTGSSDHFHNGVDIPKADGSPVFPVESGAVTSIQRTGSDAYVRVGRFAYVHINPSPSLDVGDQVVAQQTVLGTILSGQGHVHFTDGYYDSEINAIRNGGGLTPYDDPWKPIIRYVRFYQDHSEQEFPSRKVSGRVDIIVKVEEQNGPPTTYYSRLNNGTFKLGYKILSADRDSVVYEPPNGGVRFKFINKPSNSYVHNVFFKPLSSTSSHVYIVTNQVSRNDYWDTTQLPPGTYTVMVFTEDTRQNTDTAYVAVDVQEQDTAPPSPPVLKYVRRIEGGFQIAWYPNTEPDLVGYQLYYSSDNINWRLRYNENQLPADSTTATFKVFLSNPIYFKLHAVDNASVPNISKGSDVYGIKMNENESAGMIVIVDGFDRTEETGAWHLPGHSFAFTYGQAIFNSGYDGYSFDTCDNDAIIDSTVSLDKYFAVIWFVDDEAEQDETFSAREQQLIRDNIINRRGRMFISGANIAWDLDLDSDCYNTTESDNEFLNSIIKADFAGKTGIPNSIQDSGNGWFSEIEFSLDPNIIAIDSMDVITPIAPAKACLMYDSSHVAAITHDLGHPFTGPKLLYFAFPFEMIASSSNQAILMKNILAYLFVIDKVDDRRKEKDLITPESFALGQNYPNPFCPATTIRYHIPQAGHGTLKIYNIKGQLVNTIEDKNFNKGTYEVAWDGRDEFGIKVPSGVYFYVLTMNSLEIMKRKMILIR